MEKYSSSTYPFSEMLNSVFSNSDYDLQGELKNVLDSFKRHE